MGERRREPGTFELERSLRSGQVPQAVLAEIDQRVLVRHRVAEEFLARQRHHNLTAVRRAHDPGRAVHGRAEIVAIALFGGAGVQAHTHSELTGLTPCLGRERQAGRRRQHQPPRQQ